MRSNPKAKPKATRKAKPKRKTKNDYEMLKTQEFRDFESRLQISRGGFLWGNILTKTILRIIDSAISVATKLSIDLGIKIAIIIGSSNRPTFPDDQSINGACYIYTEIILFYLALSRGVMVTMTYGQYYSSSSHPFHSS